MRREPLTLDSDGLALEAELWFPDTSGPYAAVVVAHPHPTMGGTMRNNAVEAALAGLVERGVAGLRFNFRGAGGSDGTFDNGRGEQTDVSAALAAARAHEEIDAERVGLAGYSFGAVIAAAAADAARALALISFPPGLALQLTGHDIRGLLKRFDAPVLLVAGDRDRAVPARTPFDIARSLGKHAKATTVMGADHFWSGYESDLAEIVGEFFAEHLLGERPAAAPKAPRAPKGGRAR